MICRLKSASYITASRYTTQKFANGITDTTCYMQRHTKLLHSMTIMSVCEAQKYFVWQQTSLFGLHKVLRELDNGYLSSQKSLVGWGTIMLTTYWNTSVSLSSRCTTLHLMMSSSHRCRSRNSRSSTSTGGAATSTLYFHSLSGCPSPTFLYATSTSLPHDVTDTQPLNLSRDSCIQAHCPPCSYFHQFTFSYVWLSV